MWITLIRVQFFLYNFNGIPHGIGIFHFFLNFFNSMDNCGMISFPNVGSDGFQRDIDQRSAQIHNDLAGYYDLAVSFIAGNISGRNTKMLSHSINDQLRSNIPLHIRGDNILQSLFGQLHSNFPVFQIT